MFHDCIIYRAKEYTNGVNSNMMTDSAVLENHSLNFHVAKMFDNTIQKPALQKRNEHGQKLTLHSVQNDTALHFEPYWKLENEANINIWCFLKLN